MFVRFTKDDWLSVPHWSEVTEQPVEATARVMRMIFFKGALPLVDASLDPVNHYFCFFVCFFLPRGDGRAMLRVPSRAARCFPGGGFLPLSGELLGS